MPSDVTDTSDALADLSLFGLSAGALVVYRVLLAVPVTGVDDLARRSGLSEVQVREALDSLAALDLIRSSSTADRAVRAVDPRVGLRALVERRHAELARQTSDLERLRVEIMHFADEVSAPGALDGFHVIEDPDRVRSEIERLASTCRVELCSFVPGGPQAPARIAAARPLDVETLGRGVSLRTIVVDSALHDGPTREYLTWLAGLGGLIRVAPALPLRMLVIDRATAVLPVDPLQHSPETVIITQPGVVHAMTEFFERTWAVAREGVAPAPRPPALSHERLTLRHLEVARMLADGAKDEAVARALGVSLRTARRLVQELMTELEATSRFQAGVRAAREGWLT